MFPGFLKSIHFTNRSDCGYIDRRTAQYITASLQMLSAPSREILETTHTLEHTYTHTCARLRTPAVDKYFAYTTWTHNDIVTNAYMAYMLTVDTCKHNCWKSMELENNAVTDYLDPNGLTDYRYCQNSKLFEAWWRLIMITLEFEVEMYICKGKVNTEKKS